MTILKFRSLFLLLFFQCNLGYAIKGEADNDYTTIQRIEKLDSGISIASSTEETDVPKQKSSDHLYNDNEFAKIQDPETDESSTNLSEDITNKRSDQSTNHIHTKNSYYETDGSKKTLTEDMTNKTSDQSTNHIHTKNSYYETDGSKKTLTEDMTNKTTDQSPNHILTKSSYYETDGSKTTLTEDMTNKTSDQSNNHNQTIHSKIGVRGGKTGGSKFGALKGGGSKTRIIAGGRGFYCRSCTKSSGGGGDLTAFWIILGIVGVGGGGFLVGYLIFKYAGSCATE